MTKYKFHCTKCTFDKTVSKRDIPETATRCKCPKCEAVLLVSEAFIQINSEESNFIDKTVDKWFENNQLGNLKKQAEDPPSSDRYFELLDQGLDLVNENKIFEAMFFLEEAEQFNSTPRGRSYLAYCRAKENHDYSNSVKMCIAALKEEPTVADHYLNLGRIYMLINKRGPALQTFQKGIKFGPHPKLMEELRKFNIRRPPVFASLPRDHFLNRNLGKLLFRVGLR